MNSTILKIFGSGQLTIPKKWRDDDKAAAYTAIRRGHDIILRPVEREDVIFDAERDNAGAPIPAAEFLKILKRAMK